MPAHCLVCGRNTRRVSLCYHCMPKLTLWHRNYCLCCDSPMLEANDEMLCGICKNNPPIFRRIRSAWDYNTKVQAAITAMKYRPSLRLCRLLGSLLSRFAASALWTKDWDLIVPIPCSPSSLRQRGFNQALVLAECVQTGINRIRKIPISKHTLSYQGSHKAQASLNHTARLRNVNGMFESTNEASGKKLLLIDDVLTTGATSTAACVSLLKNQAQCVDLLTLARSNTWNEFRMLINTKLKL